MLDRLTPRSNANASPSRSGFGTSASHRSRAQQPAVPVPVIGLLHTGASEESASRIASIRQGLSETGYEEGQTLANEHCWADDQYDRLPALASKLVRRPVSVLVGTTPVAVAPRRSPRQFRLFSRRLAIQWCSALVASLNQPRLECYRGNFVGPVLTAK